MKLDFRGLSMRPCLLLFVSALGAMVGCETSQPEPQSETQQLAEVELSFSDQVAAGRSGLTDRIELNQIAASDEVLQSLTTQDAWVGTLILDAGVITDRGTRSIAQLPSLTHLRLRESPIGDSGMAEIAQCRSLVIVNLPQCEATAKGVAKLAELSGLKNLRLGGPKLTADTAASIATIKSLRNLHLIRVPIGDEGLRQIVSLPKLQSLYLDDSAVTAEGWDWLLEAHPGLHVHVNQKHLDRDQVTTDGKH